MKLKCQLHETKGDDDTLIVGIKKQSNRGWFETVFFIKYNESSRTIVNGNRDVTVDKDIITFSLNAKVEAGGFYRCYYERFPNHGHSANTLEVVVQGT